MTWNEVRLAALQKMFSSDGAAINEHDEAVQQYLAMMPQAANEGAGLLLAAGFGLRRAEDICTGGQCTADLAAELPRLWPGAPLELYRKGKNGTLIRADGAVLTAGRFLRLPGGGPVLAVYTSRPRAFGPDTSPDEPVELEEQGAALLPLYMASQLYKDDDITIAAQYRNEFEAALEQLTPAAAELQGGSFTSVSGWV